jgi:hypothetical protein
MKQTYVFILMSTVLLIFILPAQAQPAIVVDNISICTAVENREPVGVDTVFSSNTGQLYCYTQLTSPQDTSVISHVWFYNDEEMARVTLTLKAKKWRTWSSKRIVKEWIGDWRVEVQNSAGALLHKKSFKIQ